MIDMIDMIVTVLKVLIDVIDMTRGTDTTHGTDTLVLVIVPLATLDLDPEMILITDIVPHIVDKFFLLFVLFNKTQILITLMINFLCGLLLLDQTGNHK